MIWRDNVVFRFYWILTWISCARARVGNAISRTKLMFHTHKVRNYVSLHRGIQIEIVLFDVRLTTRGAFAFIDSRKIAPASNEIKCCAERRGTIPLPINIINVTARINSYFYFSWTCHNVNTVTSVLIFIIHYLNLENSDKNSRSFFFN